MHRDGFFWSDAELTEQAIKRRLGRRLLERRVLGRGDDADDEHRRAAGHRLR